MPDQRPFDPSMEIARLFAVNLCAALSLPDSLQEIKKRAELVHHIDGPFWQEPLELVSLVSTLARRVGEIAVRTKPYTPDIPDPIGRINIALRLWSGCLSAAKVIALETRGGPNDPKDREANMLGVDSIAAGDPVYRAGVEAAPAFKRLRNEPYSMDGVPANSPVRKDA